MKRIALSLIIIICMVQLSCSKGDHFKVLREVTGPYQTACYLIYTTESKEAALVDPGWRIDTLVTFIRNNDLRLKYIFITHGHTDHYYYVSELKKEFPEVKWCLSREDYVSIVNCPDWPVKAYGKDWVENTRRTDPEATVYLDFDTRSVGEPDIFVEGDQTYSLGSVKIKTIHTPGHSPGSICYYTGNILFSGDELFYRSVGNLDSLTSNREIFIRSVRELYRMFPDSMMIYPGHGQYTDIGSEKKSNNRISMDGGVYDSDSNQHR